MVLDMSGESTRRKGAPSVLAGGQDPAGLPPTRDRAIPILWGSEEDEAIIRPDSFFHYFKGLRGIEGTQAAEIAICCHNFKLFQAIIRKTGAQPMPWILYRDEEYPHAFDCEGRRLWIAYLGVGAAAAVMRFEVLIAAGVKSFIVFGSAGGLCRGMGIGDFVVARDAIRDEGLSYHYLEPTRTAPGSVRVLAALEKACERYSVRPLSGTTWTTDAMFRETVAKVQKYQDEGVLTVEMEAAALYAVSQVRQVETGCLFHVTDCIGDLAWQPGFHSQAVEEAKERAIEIVLKAARLLLSGDS